MKSKCLPFLSAGVAAWIFAFGPAVSGAEPAAAPVQSKVAACDSLVQFLEEQLNETKTLHQIGVAPMSDVLEAQDRLLEARMERLGCLDSPSPGEMEELRRQRLDGLTRLYEILSENYQHGTIPYEDLLETQLRLLRFRLENAPESERAALLSQQSQLLREYLTALESRYRSGTAGTEELLQTRERWLEAEQSRLAFLEEQKPGEYAGQLQELRQKRQETLAEICAETASEDDQSVAEMRLILFQLETAAGPERGELLARLRQVQDERLEYARSAYQQGVVPPQELLQVQAENLETAMILASPEELPGLKKELRENLNQQLAVCRQEFEVGNRDAADIPVLQKRLISLE